MCILARSTHWDNINNDKRSRKLRFHILGPLISTIVATKMQPFTYIYCVGIIAWFYMENSISNWDSSKWALVYNHVEYNLFYLTANETKVNLFFADGILFFQQQDTEGWYTHICWLQVILSSSPSMPLIHSSFILW